MAQTPFERLREAMCGYMQTSILAAAAELDFFTLILESENRLGASELAAKSQCDPRGTTVVLDALAALGYLHKSRAAGNVTYSVTDEYKTYLDSRHPDTFVPMMRHMACGQRTWARLTWSLKNGKPQPGQASILGEEQDKTSFIMGMNSTAVRLVGGTISSMKKAGIFTFGKDEAKLLDIGGASGTYAEAFLNELPRSRATIFDRPVGIAQAQKRFSGSAMEDRVTLITGDFMLDTLPGGFDFAWISAIIHQMNRGESRRLYRNAQQALNPGGIVAVRDYVMSGERTFPKDGAVFGVNMFVNTDSGMVYTFEEIREDLEDAGFIEVRHAVPAPNMSAIVTARKPG
ncbi:MAG: methyltransferase domain-containing protein [Desulfovibrio sp.]|jgi:predicted O-methyltransferase YrrM|nr:methyltransferase domain-containing protein [Desulfovibrio sp.]